MSFPSLRARLRMKAPLPNTALLRDELSLTLDGAPKTLSLTRLTNSEITYESDIFTLERKALNIKALGKGLVAEYLFYEGSGTTLHDSSGYGNHGTIYGGAAWKQIASGKNVLEFDGVDDYVEIPHNDVLNMSELTIEVIFKLISFPTKWAVFVLKSTSPRVADWVYGFYVYSDGDLCFGIGDGIGYDLVINQVYVSTGVWYHGVARLTSSELQIILNGELKGRTPRRRDPKPNTSSVYIAISWAPNSTYLNADIALVRLWNRALSDEEVKTLYELAGWLA